MAVNPQKFVIVRRFRLDFYVFKIPRSTKKMHFPFLLSLVIIFTPLLSFGDEAQKKHDGEAAGLLLTRISVNKTEIRDPKIAISDWRVRLKNTSSQPRWIPAVAKKTTSNYLIVRNPKQISYYVFEKRGAEWVDTDMGWRTFIGPKDKWHRIEPGEGFEFTIPIVDRFENDPASVRIEMRVAVEADSKKFETLVTNPFTHIAAQDRADQSSDVRESKSESVEKVEVEA